MKKSLLVILLAAVLVLNLCGCSIVPNPTVTTGRPTTTATIPDTVPETTEEPLPWRPGAFNSYQYSSTRENPNHAYQITWQVLPEKLDNPNDLPVLKWVCMVDSASTPESKTWNEAAVVEFNQMLADRNLPYRVQFTILVVGGYPTPWDLFTNPEILKELEDADLIYGNCTAQDMEQWLLPITDHIYGDAQPALAGALPDPLSWFSAEANGEIYGIPRTDKFIGTSGWLVDADFMQKFGLTAKDFQKDFWEMDKLFAEIYEKNGNQPFLGASFAGNGGIVQANSATPKVPIKDAFMYSPYQGICLNLSIDLQAEKPKVVNVLETDYFAKVHDAALRYVKAEYITNEADLEMIRYVSVKCSSEPYLSVEDNGYVIPGKPIALQSLNYMYLTGVSAKSNHSEEALSLLEQIITDDALRLQLCYGKEGRDYTIKDGVYSLVIQEDGSFFYMDFLSPQATFFEFRSEDPDTAWSVASTSNTQIIKHEGMSLLESYKKSISQVTFCHCPIVFDLSKLDAELTALSEVWCTYVPMFTNPDFYLEEYVQRMLRDMNEAGMQTVITELQRQLDAWIAEHPDWNPLERS